MKIKLTLTLDLGDSFINEKDNEEREWLLEILKDTKQLFLHSNEIGDCIGEVIRVENIILK